MCLFSRSGYRPFINPPPCLGNLLCRYKSMLNFIPVSFCFFFVNFRVRVRVRVRVSYR